MVDELRALQALKDKVTDELLDPDGRYFADSYEDLSKCHHGCTCNFLNRADGKAIAILWNLWRGGKLAPIVDAEVAHETAEA